LELPEGSARGPSGDLARVAERIWKTLQRVVERQGEVPRLSGEDHQDRRQLEPDVPGREQGHQSEDESGKKPEDRNALKDIEEREEQPLGGPRLRGRPTEPEGEQ